MKKTKARLLKSRICNIARSVACASFVVLAVIGVSSIVRAMSLSDIANENGIPASWEIASLGNPDTITVPITYWDQKMDNCRDRANRQFEWTACGKSHSGADQGIVQQWLGADGYPVPSFTSATEAKSAGIDQTSQYVIGHNPVQPTDNFYRWFHETDKSKRVDRELTFTRTGNNTYTYGGKEIYPLDDIDFSKSDSTNRNHNYHFTAHMSIAMKISADGKERFDFSGDDDVWVYLNNQLVLDIGGLHEAIDGWFIINPDGTLTTHVDGVGQKTINIGVKAGDVVNLDFFYAERSTTEANTKITISHMNWPISADSSMKATTVGKIADTNQNLVEYVSSITNRDPDNELTLERVAAYIDETTVDPTGETADVVNKGFLPLDKQTLYYTTTPNDNNSWQSVDITAPENSTSGFNLVTPLVMSPGGQAGDSLYFRYYAQTSGQPGETTFRNQTAFYTTLGGDSGVTYDWATTSYSIAMPEPEPEIPTGPEVPVEPEQPEEPEPETPVEPEAPEQPEEPEPETPVEPEQPEEPEPEIPTEPEVPVEPETPVEPEQPEIPEEPDTPEEEVPVIPPSDIIDDNLVYLPPLGEIVFVPNTGIVRDAIAPVFEQYFASIILSQGFVMGVLLIFAGSFAIFFSTRKYQKKPTVTKKTATKTKKPTAKTKKSTKAKRTARGR